MPMSMQSSWVGVAAVLPLLLGLLAAWPLWSRGVSDEIGSIVGAGAIFLCAVVLIGREFAEIRALESQCRAAAVACRFTPAPFTRYAIYASIAMVQVFAVFTIGLWKEERQRRRRRHRR